MLAADFMQRWPVKPAASPECIIAGMTWPASKHEQAVCEGNKQKAHPTTHATLLSVCRAFSDISVTVTVTVNNLSLECVLTSAPRAFLHRLLREAFQYEVNEASGASTMTGAPSYRGPDGAGIGLHQFLNIGRSNHYLALILPG